MRDRCRHVRRRERRAAARRPLQLDQDLAEELAGRVDRRLRGARWYEEDAAGLHGDLNPAGPFDLGVDPRPLEDAQHVRKIVAVAVGALTRREIHLPDAYELVLEQQLVGDLAERAIILRHAQSPKARSTLIFITGPLQCLTGRR